MSISRRNFLRKTTMTGLSAVAALSFTNLAFGQSYGHTKKMGGPEIFEVPAEAYNTVLDKISMKMFKDFVNSTFVITHPQYGKMEVYLKEVEDLRPPAFKFNAKAGYECFNLILVSQNTVAFGQDTYTFEHAKLGTFELFIVPGTNQRYGRNYCATINRLYP
jgi:hypothetical protein